MRSAALCFVDMLSVCVVARIESGGVEQRAGGDQSAIGVMPVPKGAERERFCRSEWEEEGRYSRLGTIRLQLKHLVINKQAGENLTKSGFAFICFVIIFF